MAKVKRTDAEANRREEIPALMKEVLNNPDLINRCPCHSVFIKRFEGKGTLMVMTMPVQDAEGRHEVKCADWMVPPNYVIQEQRQAAGVLLQ